MPCSTRQLDDLATVTLRKIRHDHDVGLLPEPERRPNGYKQYDIAHLVTVLRIKRMSSLDLPLDQIAAMLDSPVSADEQLRALHTEHTDTITRLERACAEVSRALDSVISPDITSEAVVAMNALGHEPYGRSIATIITDLLRPPHPAETFEALAESPNQFSDLNEEFARLSPDAGANETELLTERIVEAFIKFLTQRPSLSTSAPITPQDDAKIENVVEAMKSGMNPAQAHTLDRVAHQLKRRFHDIAQERTQRRHSRRHRSAPRRLECDDRDRPHRPRQPRTRNPRDTGTVMRPTNPAGTAPAHSAPFPR